MTRKFSIGHNDPFFLSRNADRPFDTLNRQPTLYYATRERWSIYLAFHSQHPMPMFTTG